VRLKRRIAQVGKAGVLAAAAAVALVAAACGDITTGTTATTQAFSTTPITQPPPPSTRLLAADGAAGDNFGGALWYNTYEDPVKPVYYATAGEAAMSSDGTVAVVGASGHAVDGNVGAGAAYVYELTSSRWRQVGMLTPEKPQPYDGFGWSVAISGDGHTVVVGAPNRDSPVNQDIGGAYIFSDTSGSWLLVAALRSTDVNAYDEFGSSVAISRDGSTVIAGSPGHGEAPTGTDGSAYVIQQVSGVWSVTHKIAPQRSEKNSNFGMYVALDADGNTAVVTRYSHFDNQQVYRKGATFVFATTDGWKTSEQRAMFVDPNQNSDKTTDAYGVNAVLSDDGKVAAVAAPDVNVGSSGGAGAAYVYTTTGDWSQPTENRTITLLPPAPANFGYYGSSVALSADGTVLWIGVDGGGSNAQGEGALVRPRSNGNTGRWARGSYVQTAVSAPHDGQGRFGTAVSMSADGTTLLGTSPWLDVGKNDRQGAAFVINVAPNDPQL
jgi:FG-GAP repeat protein